jgi:hypothetical protein
MLKSIIAVLYDLENSLITIGKLDLFASHNGISEKIAVFNNPAVYARIKDLIPLGWKSIQGSNSAHEFSGYQEGVNSLSSDLRRYGCIVLANDTISRPNGHLGTEQLNKLQAFVRNWRKAVACGLIHYASPGNKNMMIYSKLATPWISTGLFLLSGKALWLLSGQINYVEEIEALIEKSTSSQRIFTRSTDLALSDHVTSWLCEGYAGGWNKTSTLEPSSKLPILRTKAKMILCESYLSIALRSREISFIRLPSDEKPHAKQILFKLLRFFKHNLFCWSVLILIAGNTVPCVSS